MLAHLLLFFFFTNMQPGVNNISAAGHVAFPSINDDPLMHHVVTTFLSRFVSNLDTNVTMHGVSYSSPYAVLNPAFSALNVSAVFPGLGGGLLKSAQQFITPASLTANFTNASLTLFNPINVDIDVIDG